MAEPAPAGAAAWSSPSPRLLRLWRLLALLVVGGLGAAGTAVAAAAPRGHTTNGETAAAVAAALLLSTVLGWLSWHLAGRRWAAWGWAERADDLVVRRGVVVRRVTVVPYGRMQYVDVLAGPLDRRIGVAAVHLHTASAAADIHIPGLERADAERMRDRLAALGEARAAGL